MGILTDYDDVLTFQELKNILKIGKNKCYQLLQDGIISSVKIGSTYRIPKTSVIKYLQNQK